MNSRKIWKQSDPLEAPITTKLHECCTLGFIESVHEVQHPSQPQAPAWPVLNSQHFIVLISMIPKDHNNITTNTCLPWLVHDFVCLYKERNTFAFKCYNGLIYECCPSWSSNVQLVWTCVHVIRNLQDGFHVLSTFLVTNEIPDRKF
jgi:hypothetical protein